MRRKRFRKRLPITAANLSGRRCRRSLRDGRCSISPGPISGAIRLRIQRRRGGGHVRFTNNIFRVRSHCMASRSSLESMPKMPTRRMYCAIRSNRRKCPPMKNITSIMSGAAGFRRMRSSGCIGPGFSVCRCGMYTILPTSMPNTIFSFS
ncbi:hypothetical protein SDC9_168082 [bioreactor metagenome]|uniref:Uncharacterized protein n=1 Tax=bioreactor metagenome TaxID=1076179 RepID=A0A645G9Y4_9ZZZZ